MYKHHFVSILIVISISTGCMIGCLFIENKTEGKSFFGGFGEKKYQIIILQILSLAISIGFCIGILIQKHLLEIKFVSPLKILYFKGIIGIFASSLGLIFSSNIECEPNESVDYTKGIIDYLNCSNEYNNSIYYDHFSLYFKDGSMKKTEEALILLLYALFNFFTELSLILINKYLSPTHYLIAESLYSLIHPPLQFYTKDKDIEKNQLTIILKFLSSLSEIISYLIFLEIIELKFWGLNLNLRKNISQRAQNEQILLHRENSDSDYEKTETEGDKESQSLGSSEKSFIKSEL